MAGSQIPPYLIAFIEEHMKKLSSFADADFFESHGCHDNGSRLSVTGSRYRLF